MTEDPDDVTLASYQAAADIFIERTRTAPPALLAYLDRVAGLVGQGHILELGVTLLEHVPGRTDQWLHVIAQRDESSAYVDV